MRRKTTPAIAAAAGLAAALAGIAPASGAQGTETVATPTTRASRAAPEGRAAPAVAKPSQIVTLPTGDLVGLSTGPTGAPRTSILGRISGGAATSMRVGGATYLIPRSVQDVVGTKLDPQLFNATRIAQRTGGRTPVTLSYASAGAATAVPGVEVTGRSGLTGRGFITPSSSRALGRALAGTSAATLFAGLSAVRMADPGDPAARWPMHTVTLRLIGRDGRPAPGPVGYLNVTDAGKGGGMAFANYKGIAKVSMPSGTYQLLGSGFEADLSAGYLAASPEFTVTGPRTATLDLRTATQALSTRVSKPLADSFAFTSLERNIPGDPYGSSMSFGLLAPGDLPVEFAPTVGPLHGEQALVQSVLAGSPASARSPYIVATLNSKTGRLPAAPVTFVENDRTMTTAKSVVHGLRDYSRSMFTSYVGNESGGFGMGVRLTGPKLTRYLSAGPGLNQNGELFAVQDDESMTFAGWQNELASPGTPGRVFADPWLAAPLHSNFPQTEQPVCWSCVQDGQVIVTSLPMSDTNPRHFGNPDMIANSIRGTYAVLADASTIASGEGFLYDAGGAIPAGAKVITARQSATRSGSPFRQTTRLTTEMSTPLSAAIALPPGGECPGGDSCRALPMLSADYQAAVDVDNRLSAGSQSIGILVHQVGRLTPRGIRSVKAWISYDGHTWTTAPVTGSGANYRAAITVPRGSGTAGLKVVVTDAAGSTLTETIDGAFLLPR